jgi:hypothetical protein
VKETDDKQEGPADETVAKATAHNSRLTGVWLSISIRLFEAYTVLKYPLLFALFSLDLGCVLMPLMFVIPTYGFVAVVALVASQTPVIFLILREAWRQSHLKTPIDRWEISDEQWNATLNEYAEALQEND